MLPLTNVYLLQFAFNLTQSSEDLFSVEPFAPTSANSRHAGAGRSGNDSAAAMSANSSSIMRVVPDESAANFLSRHDIGFRLRSMDADVDDGGMDNGQDEEDASEQDDAMPADQRDRPLLNHQRSASNIDDEVQDPDADQVNAFFYFQLRTKTTI